MDTHGTTSDLHEFDNINSCHHPQIIEKRDLKTVIIAVLCIVLGGVFVCNSFIFNTGDELAISLVIMGISGISFGIISWAVHAKQKVYEKTGSVIKAPIFYFSREYLTFSEHLLAHGSFDTKKTIPLLDNGKVSFHVLSSRDNRFAAVQLFEFSSSSFQPVTPIYYFEDDKALLFWEYINRCKTNTKRLKYNLR
jgi:hypothetical protein